jgi:hypothetical protein
MYDKQMQDAFADPSMGLNAAEVQQNPDAFLRNPMKATTSTELAEIYAFNEKVLSLASQPIRAQEGMQVGEAPAEAAHGPTGFVEQRPENLDDATKVADDVPVDVPEGSFVINAAAVEFAGSEDIKNLIVGAIEEARRQGIDISGNANKIDIENAASLLVSEGEVLVSPVLAKIIGYDKLNKINARGIKETERRVAEAEQAPQQEPQAPPNPAEGMAMQMGGEATTQTSAEATWSGSPEAKQEIANVYESINRQGGDAGEFGIFEQATSLYQQMPTYRPMKAQYGTDEYDIEVRNKYGFAFPETKDGMLKDNSMKQAEGPRIVTREREDGSLYYINADTGEEVSAPNQDSGAGFLTPTP